jgi:UMF1 family MFS transporter
MVPKARSSEYFGAFNLIGKFASVFGPLLVAVTVTLTGESRWGMLGLLVLFILGAAFLWAVKEPTEEGDHHSLVDVP